MIENGSLASRMEAWNSIYSPKTTGCIILGSGGMADPPLLDGKNTLRHHSRDLWNSELCYIKSRMAGHAKRERRFAVSPETVSRSEDNGWPLASDGNVFGCDSV